MFVPIDNPFDVTNVEATEVTEDNEEHRKPEEESKNQSNNEFNDSKEFPTDEMNHCIKS